MGYKNDLEYIEKRLDEISTDFQETINKSQRRKLNYEVKFLDNARNAIRKQVPMKPKFVCGEKTNTHRYGRLISFHCPSCNRFIVALYENDVDRGGGISNELKGCSSCLQAIDFTGYYAKKVENEEVVFDD